jgi:hypothetical protein
VAEELAGLDLDLQASRNPLKRAQLANALEYTAAAYDIAERRAVRVVFTLRMQEHALEDANALMVRGQREDLERAKMMARVH